MTTKRKKSKVTILGREEDCFPILVSTAVAFPPLKKSVHVICMWAQQFYYFRHGTLLLSCCGVAEAATAEVVTGVLFMALTRNVN